MSVHTSVLLNEVIKHLEVKPNKKYIDATLGAGGHTRAILDQGGLVLGLDQDQEILNYVRNQLNHRHLTLVHGNFNNLAALAKSHGFEQVDGILFDLGVSSLQLDSADRGFSFQHDAPLDMRMDQETELTAKELVNTLTEAELFTLLTTYSQERQARQIARAIVATRKSEPIETTQQLANIVENVYGGRGKIHPATKTFQALRMAVNQELTALKIALPQAVELLSSQGRLAVISFHEGEDRLVKQFIQQHKDKLASTTKKPIIPTDQEIRNNPRSRSARLRVAVKL